MGLFLVRLGVVFVALAAPTFDIYIGGVLEKVEVVVVVDIVEKWISIFYVFQIAEILNFSANFPFSFIEKRMNNFITWHWR